MSVILSKRVRIHEYLCSNITSFYRRISLVCNTKYIILARKGNQRIYFISTHASIIMTVDFVFFVKLIFVERVVYN